MLLREEYWESCEKIEPEWRWEGTEGKRSAVCQKQAGWNWAKPTLIWRWCSLQRRQERRAFLLKWVTEPKGWKSMQLLVSPQKIEQFQQEGSNRSLAPECPVHQWYWQSDQINHLEDYNRGSLNSLKDRSKVLISVNPLRRASTTELPVGRQGKDATAIFCEEIVG